MLSLTLLITCQGYFRSLESTSGQTGTRRGKTISIVFGSFRRMKTYLQHLFFLKQLVQILNKLLTVVKFIHENLSTLIVVSVQSSKPYFSFERSRVRFQCPEALISKESKMSGYQVAVFCWVHGPRHRIRKVFQTCGLKI